MSEASGTSGTRQWELIGAVGLLAVLSIWFLSGRIHYLTDYSKPSYSDYYWPRRSGLVLHLTGGFATAAVGSTYLVATIPGHFAYASGLAGMMAASLVTTGMAVFAIRRRDIKQHKAWMIRSYAVMFAFVTYRLGSMLGRNLVPLPDDPVATDFDVMLAWASWAVPLMVVEVGIQLKAMRRIS